MAQYRAGQWQAILNPVAAVLVSPETSRAQLAALWERVQESATLTAIADTLIEGTSGSLTDIPSFAAALVEGDRVRIAVRGPLEVKVETDAGAETLTGENVTIWNERAVAGVTRVTVTTSGADTSDPLPFLGGIVRAASLVFEPAGAALPVVAEGPETPIDAVPLIAPELVPDPEPVSDPESVEGSETSIDAFPVPAEPDDEPASDVTLIPSNDDEDNGHEGVEVFDSLFADTIVHAPKAPSAQGDHDGATISISQMRALRQEPAADDETPTTVMPVAVAQRGRIRLSTGQDVALDRTVIIGRRPRSTRASGTDLPHLIAVESPQQDISRNHLEIRPEGDTVVVADLHTTNGSTLLRPGADPVRLHPGEQTLVLSGDVIDLGDGVTVTFEELS